MKGDWNLLTIYLIGVKKRKIEMSDDEMRRITHSTDRRAILPLDDNRRYSIRRRAAAAGYDVKYSPISKHIKVFTWRKKGAHGTQKKKKEQGKRG